MDEGTFENIVNIIMEINHEGYLRIQVKFREHFRDHLREYPDVRKNFTDDIVETVDRAIDEEGETID